MICGIDPSLTGTGVVIGDGDTWSSRTFTSKPGSDDVLARLARCERLITQTTAWIGSHDVTCVYIEAYAFSRSNGRQIYSAEFGGILRWNLAALRDWRIVIVEIAPSALKKFVTGKGNAQKNMMGAHVSKRWGVLLRNDNEVDAFGLYRLGLCCEGLVRPQTIAQQEVVAKILGTTASRRRGASADQTILNLEEAQWRNKAKQQSATLSSSSTAKSSKKPSYRPGQRKSSNTTTPSKRRTPK